MKQSLLLCLMLTLFTLKGQHYTKGIHIPDNGDGTFSNPVMPNAHWSDPCLVKVKDDYYCVTSAPETSPVIQILHSKDLVNWSVIGSVSRFWPAHYPATMNWSPRISFINDKYRIMGHITHEYMFVFQADHPEGPWSEVKHSFTNMQWQWAPNLYKDDDGQVYLFANDWIQRVNESLEGFIGQRIVVVKGNNLENPSLIKRNGYYYWFESQNGTDYMGNTPGFAKITVWRSKNITGPYQGPSDMILGNNKWQSVNTGTAILGPDNNWWYCYNTWDMLRLSMCRQMHLDKIQWDKQDWPHVNDDKGPGDNYKKPVNVKTDVNIPDLNDEFNEDFLQGITHGPLGSKWLFREEKENSWSVKANPGNIRLYTLYPDVDQQDAPNFMCQRPVAAYYRFVTKVRLHPTSIFQQAGIAVREMCSKNGIYLSVFSNWFYGGDTSLCIRVSHCNQTEFKEIAQITNINESKKPIPYVYLRIDWMNFNAQSYYSLDGKNWIKIGQEFGYNWERSNNWNRYWSTFYPGIFAGSRCENPNAGYADFDFFRMELFDR